MQRGRYSDRWQSASSSDEKLESASESSAGQLWRLRLNSVARGLWRGSKLCTWFVFLTCNLLSLEPARGSYLTSAFFYLKNARWYLKADFGGRRGELERTALQTRSERKWVSWDLAAGCGLSKESRKRQKVIRLCWIYICNNTYGVYYCFSLFLAPSPWTSRCWTLFRYFLWDVSKGLTWFFAQTVSTNTVSDQMYTSDTETHTSLNFHLCRSQDVLRLVFFLRQSKRSSLWGY